jgi:DNA repair exonuclease SbcCD ATPase subunit
LNQAEKQKRIIELQAQKDHFVATLSQVSKELLSVNEIGVGLTPESLEAARQRVQGEIEQLQTERQSFIAALAAQVNTQPAPRAEEQSELDRLAEELAELEARGEQIQVAVERNELRLTEMMAYRSSVEQEAGRLERAMKAGSVLAELKVTHCPVCDQPISPQASDTTCFLCHRPMTASAAATSAARLEMEVAQTKAVWQEATEMVAVLEKDRERLKADTDQVKTRVTRIRSMLRPVRHAAAAILPPEIGILDMKVGQKQEQIAQIDRVAKTLAYRDVLGQEIRAIQQETARLEQEVTSQSGGLDFEQASGRLQDGMTNYLNAINSAVSNSWTQKEPRVRLDEKKARFLVGDRKWDSQLGGTLQLYYLIAYHYALMSLVKHSTCHFPGFLALDFPAEVDGASTRDTENFAVEPFVKLLAGDPYRGCQVIAAGVAFENLTGAHRIGFSKIWK